MAKRKRRTQRRIPGQTREALPSCVVEVIRERVQRLAIRYNCSKSFVIATLLAEALNIYTEEKFYVIDEGRDSSRRSKVAGRKRKGARVAPKDVERDALEKIFLWTSEAGPTKH
jgi:hypothetical protein